MSKKNLFETLIPKDLQADFFNAFENSKSFTVHGLNSPCLTELLKLPCLESLDGLIKTWPSPVDVHLPEARDEITTLRVSSTEAQSHFTNGQSLLFNDVNLSEQKLEDWLTSIRIALGVSSQTFSRCLIYATPKDGGNAPHFDQNINFVLQIHGHKTWWTAPNTSVKNPLSRHAIGHETDLELQSYSEKEMPKDFPKNSTKHNLKPGSLLFVPQGLWHKTQAQTDALSLNFTFSPPAWIDLFTAALRGRLLQSELWRETAKGFSSKESLEKFDFLLDNLARDSQNWSAQDILEAIEP